jgi:hypothetical protein
MLSTSCRSQWARGLRHELSSLARTLGSWVRIPFRSWILVCVCIGSGLTIRWSPVRGVLPTILGLRNWSETQRFTDVLCSKVGATGKRQLMNRTKISRSFLLATRPTYKNKKKIKLWKKIELPNAKKIYFIDRTNFFAYNRICILLNNIN